MYINYKKMFTLVYTVVDMYFLAALHVVIIYGVALVIYTTNATSIWAAWVASVLFWVLAVLDYVMLYVFISDLITKHMTRQEGLRRLLDLYIAMTHALAGIGFSLFMLDGTLAKNQFFLNIDTTASPYAIYVADFLHCSTLVVNTVGFPGVVPRPSVVLPALWAMTTSITGWVTLGFVAVLVFRNIKKAAPLDPESVEAARRVYESTGRLRWDSGVRPSTSDKYPLPSITHRVTRRKNKP